MDNDLITRYRTALKHLAVSGPLKIDETVPEVGSDGEIEQWVRENKEFAVSES
jgi:hypothetical protein